MKCGDKVYRVYWYNGEVVVRKGKVSPTGNFVPDDNPKTYLTQNPTLPMKIEHGKVYCYNEEDIPKAIEMVKRHHDFYLEEAEDRLNRSKNGGPLYKRTKSDSPLICPKCKRQFNMGGSRRKLNWSDGIMMDGHKFRKSECFHCGCEFYFCNTSADYARECRLKCVYEKDEFERMIMEMNKEKSEKMPTVKEAIKILQDGSHKYMTREYLHAYGMAIGALEIVDDLDILSWDAKSETVKDVWDGLTDEEKELCVKLLNGEISATEYTKQSEALKKKKDGDNYEFVCSEAEFKAIKHALEHLYLTNRRALSPVSPYPNYRTYSVDRLHRMKVENAVIGDLMDAISEVDKNES